MLEKQNKRKNLSQGGRDPNSQSFCKKGLFYLSDANIQQYFLSDTKFEKN